MTLRSISLRALFRQRIKGFHKPLIAAVAATSVTLLVAISVSVTERQRVIDDAGRDDLRVAQTLAAQVKRTYDAAEIVLGVVDQWVGMTHDLGDRQMIEGALARIREVAGVRFAVRIADEDGIVLNPPAGSDQRRMTIAGWDYFRGVRQLDAGIFYVAAPMNAFDAREWMLPLSMKASPNARGVAVLTVLIPMNFMQYLLEQTHRSGGDAVLMRADGTVLLRDPHGAAFVDKAIPQGAVLARWRDQEHGAYVVDRLADGTRRLNAFSNVPGLPIVVGHGIDLDQVLKPWQAAAQWHAAITIVVIALVWLLAGLMARAVRDDEAYKLKLLRAKERAEAASRAKSKFLAVTSHELRTPLNAIMGFSEMISLRIFGGDLDRYCRYAEDIHRSAAHLLSIIEEILDVSRLEAGKLDLHEEVIDLVEISTEIIELLQPQAANAGVALTAPTARGPVVHADAKAVRQMLLNLASNSLKFTNSGGRVEIGAGTASGRPFLRVADTGIGIKPEHQALVLEPFGQVADAMAREQGGLGLGLPIVKNLIQLHGGDMTLDSAPGRGTTITLVFPANRLLAEATSAPPRPERIVPTVIAAAA